MSDAGILTPHVRLVNRFQATKGRKEQSLFVNELVDKFEGANHEEIEELSGQFRALIQSTKNANFSQKKLLLGILDSKNVESILLDDLAKCDQNVPLTSYQSFKLLELLTDELGTSTIETYCTSSHSKSDSNVRLFALRLLCQEISKFGRGNPFYFPFLYDPDPEIRMVAWSNVEETVLCRHRRLQETEEREEFGSITILQFIFGTKQLRDQILIVLRSGGLRNAYWDCSVFLSSFAQHFWLLLDEVTHNRDLLAPLFRLYDQIDFLAVAYMRAPMHQCILDKCVNALQTQTRRSKESLNVICQFISKILDFEPITLEKHRLLWDILVRLYVDEETKCCLAFELLGQMVKCCFSVCMNDHAKQFQDLLTQLEQDDISMMNEEAQANFLSFYNNDDTQKLHELFQKVLSIYPKSSYSLKAAILAFFVRRSSNCTVDVLHKMVEILIVDHFPDKLTVDKDESASNYLYCALDFFALFVDFPYISKEAIYEILVPLAEIYSCSINPDEKILEIVHLKLGHIFAPIMNHCVVTFQDEVEIEGVFASKPWHQFEHYQMQQLTIRKPKNLKSRQIVLDLHFVPKSPKQLPKLLDWLQLDGTLEVFIVASGDCNVLKVFTQIVNANTVSAKKARFEFISKSNESIIDESLFSSLAEALARNDNLTFFSFQTKTSVLSEESLDCLGSGLGSNRSIHTFALCSPMSVESCQKFVPLLEGNPILANLYLSAPDGPLNFPELSTFNSFPCMMKRLLGTLKNKSLKSAK